MKYVNRLTNKDLEKIYKLFIEEDAIIDELNITKNNYSVILEGFIKVKEWKEDILKENPNATVIFDDDYELTDYDVKVYSHSGNVTKLYRKYMYNKFGNQYAIDYLLGE